MKYFKQSLIISLLAMGVYLIFSPISQGLVTAQSTSFAESCRQYSRAVMDGVNDYAQANQNTKISIPVAGAVDMYCPPRDGEDEPGMATCTVRLVDDRYHICYPFLDVTGNYKFPAREDFDTAAKAASTYRKKGFCDFVWEQYMPLLADTNDPEIQQMLSGDNSCSNGTNWSKFIPQYLDTDARLGYIDDITGDPRCDNGNATGLSLNVFEGGSVGEVDIRVQGCVTGLPDGGDTFSLYYFLDGGDAVLLGNVTVPELAPNVLTTFTGVNVRSAQNINVCVSVKLDQTPSSPSAALICSGDYGVTAPEEGGDTGGGTVVDAEGEPTTPGNLNGVEACQLSQDPQAGASCRNCLEAGGTWTALGCIITTPTGVFTFLIQIAIGVMGGVALLRMIYLGYLYQTGDDGKIKEAQQGVVSIIGGIFVVVFSIVILRIIGVNILDVVPAGFFG